MAIRKYDPAIPAALERFDALPDVAFVRIAVVQALYACSPATVWRRTQDGRIPKPVKLSSRSTVWRVGDLRKHLRELAEA